MHLRVKKYPSEPSERLSHALLEKNTRIIGLYNCTSSLISRTSSPGLKAGNPMYGHPSHLNASPNAQLPQLPTFPCTVKSTSASSSDFSFAAELREDKAASALARLAASSASIFWARPQVQSLQARRRLPALGRHSGAGGRCQLEIHRGNP